MIFLKKLFNWLFDTRIGYAIFLMLGSVLFSALLGSFFALITLAFEPVSGNSFLKMIGIVYLVFGAPIGVASIICFLFPRLDKEMAYGFGYGIYYGGMLLSKILSAIDTEDNIISGFLCAILICVAVFYSIGDKG